MRPTCRTHYGGILIALGRWTEAETQLCDAIETFERGYHGDGTFPLVRLADLRVRQGRYEEAERLLEGVEWHPTARRAAATIALARGDLALAEETAQLCFEGSDPADPRCGRCSSFSSRFSSTARRRRRRGTTLARLETLASGTGDELVRAFAELGAGRMGAAEGSEHAAAHLTRALEVFRSWTCRMRPGGRGSSSRAR